jgi:hypothetical protein
MKHLQLLFRTTVAFYMTYEMSRWWIRQIFFWQVTLCTSLQSLIVLNNIINLNFCLEGLRKTTERSRHSSHRHIEIQNRTAQWHRSQAEPARATEFTWLYHGALSTQLQKGTFPTRGYMLCQSSGDYSQTSHIKGPGSTPGSSTWDLMSPN